MHSYGPIPLDTLKSMTGLDMLRGMIDGQLPSPPICATLGFRLAEAELGRVVFEATPGPQHYNPIGTVHGGFTATLLDSCMACAVHSTLQPGQSYTTLEFKISFARAITSETGKVSAEGRILNVGRRAGFAEGRLTDGQGRLLAHGTTTCVILSV